MKKFGKSKSLIGILIIILLMSILYANSHEIIVQLSSMINFAGDSNEVYATSETTSTPEFYGTVGINLKVGDTLDLNSSVFRIYAKDSYGEDLTQNIKIIENTVNVAAEGQYHIKYSVANSQEVTKEIIVPVEINNSKERTVQRMLYPDSDSWNTELNEVKKGNYHDRQNLGIYAEAGANIEIREVTGNIDTLSGEFLNNASEQETTFKVTNDWTTITTEYDSVPFIRSYNINRKIRYQMCPKPSYSLWSTTNFSQEEENTIYFANVFNKKYENEAIDKITVSLYNCDRAEIYINPTGGNINSEGYIHLKTIESPSNGDAIIKLTEPVTIESDKFIVAVKYTGSHVPFFRSTELDHYTYISGNLSSNWQLWKGSNSEGNYNIPPIICESTYSKTEQAEKIVYQMCPKPGYKLRNITAFEKAKDNTIFFANVFNTKYKNDAIDSITVSLYNCDRAEIYINPTGGDINSEGYILLKTIENPSNGDAIIKLTEPIKIEKDKFTVAVKYTGSQVPIFYSTELENYTYVSDQLTSNWTLLKESNSEGNRNIPPIICTSIYETEATILEINIEDIFEEDSLIKPLDYYLYGDDEEAFFENWRNTKNSFAVIESDRITCLVPYGDINQIAIKNTTDSKKFKTLNELFEYYKELFEMYDNFIGLEDNSANRLHQNVKTKYFAKANSTYSNPKAYAYYGQYHTAQVGKSMSGYFTKAGWGLLHEIGHGYEGDISRNDINLRETQNNIFAYYMQQKYLEDGDYGWIGCKFSSFEKECNEVRKSLTDEQNFNSLVGDSVYDNCRSRLYMMLNMLNKIGPENGMPTLYRNSREDHYYGDGTTRESDLIAKSFSDAGKINLVPYLESWHIEISEEFKDEIKEKQYPIAYYLRELVNSDEQAEEIRAKLGLEGIYSLVTNTQLESYNLKGIGEIQLSTEEYNKVAGNTIQLKSEGKVVKTVEIADEVIAIADMPIGVYDIELVSEDYELDADYVVIADTLAPTFTALQVTNPQTGTYKAGETINIEATFSEEIKGTVPTLSLLFGGTKAKGTINEGEIVGNKIQWSYTITDGDNGELTGQTAGGELIDIAGNAWEVTVPTLGGYTITADTKVTFEVTGNATTWTNQDIKLQVECEEELSSIKVNGQAIEGKVYTVSANGEYLFEVTDKVGNASTKTIVVDKIDKIAPILSTIKVTSPEAGKYKTGQIIKIEATHSEEIKGTIPTLSISFGANKAKGTINAGQILGNKIQWSYTITDGDNGELTGSISAGAITDLAGNSLEITTAILENTKITSDTIAPTLVETQPLKVTSPNTGTYKAGEKIEIEATYSEEIKGTVPALSLTFGGIKANGTKNEGKIVGNKIQWSYTIAEGDNGELEGRISGGELVDIAGNAWKVTIPTLGGYTITADTTLTFEVTGNATSWTNQDVNLQVECEEELSSIKVNGQPIEGTVYTAKTNEEYVFEVTDKAGNILIKTITVDKIDKTTPIGTIIYSTETVTNENVTASISFNEENVTITNKGGKTTYEFEENGEFTFEFVDKAGNIGSTVAKVEWIDKTAPIGTIEYSPAITTNGNVIASISFNEENVIITNNGAKNIYEFEENGEFTFEFVDGAGNTGSEVAKVDWIDKNAPIGTIEYSTEELTKENVTASISFEEENVTITNNEGKATYEFEENGEFTFIFKDAVGNIGSTVAKVDWIDKTAPIGTISYSPETATNGNVIASISFDEENVTITNNAGATYEFTENKEFTFEFVDAAGNTGSATARVDWIDRIAPIGTIAYSTENPTNGNVTASINFNEDNVTITNNECKDTYEFEENEEFTFEFVDVAGNTGSATARVDWIDKIAPTGTISYSTETATKGNVTANITFNEENVTIINNEGKNTYEFTENGEFTFTFKDNVGNIGSTVAKVDWIDKTAPIGTISYSPETATNGNVIASISFDEENVTITNNAGATYEFTENKEFTFQFVDKAGNTGSATARVDWIDRIAPIGTIAYSTENPTNGNVTASISFNEENVTITNNDGKNTYEFEENEEFTFEFVDAAGNTGSATARVDWIDKIAPTGTISYSTETATNGNVTANITFNEENVTITNNEGKATYEFEENGEFTFTFKDNVGNIGSTVAKVEWIDKTSPIGTIIYTPETATNGNVTASISFNEENVTITNNEGRNTCEFTKNGEFKFEFKDAVGNIGSSTARVDWIDRTAPILSKLEIISPENGIYNVGQTIEIEATFNEEIKGTVANLRLLFGYKEAKGTMNAGEISGNKIKWNYVLTEGDNGKLTGNIFEGVLTDLAGNLWEVTKVAIAENSIIADTVVNFEIIGNTTEWTTEDVKLQVQSKEELSSIKVNGQAIEGTVYTVSANGEYLFEVTDKVGNTSTKTVIVDKIDKTAPEMILNYNSLVLNEGDTIEVEVLVKDEEVQISYSWDNESYEETTEYVNTLKIEREEMQKGTYKLYVKATDKLGNESETKILEFRVNVPDIIFNELETAEKDEIRYVKIPTSMRVEEVTSKIDTKGLYGETPTYSELTEDDKVKTGSKILLNDEIKYVVVIIGDVNSDGEVTFKDIIRTNALRITGEENLPQEQLIAADINNSGKIEFKDIISINAIRINSIKLNKSSL